MDFQIGSVNEKQEFIYYENIEMLLIFDEYNLTTNIKKNENIFIHPNSCHFCYFLL